MKSAQKLILVVSLGLVLFSVFAFAQQKGKASAGQKTYTGAVTDTVCGTKHMMKDMSDAECAKMCVEHGGDYALAVGSKIYTLTGSKEAIAKLAGHKAKVTGTLSADTITVDSIESADTHK